MRDDSIGCEARIYYRTYMPKKDTFCCAVKPFCTPVPRYSSIRWSSSCTHTKSRCSWPNILNYLCCSMWRIENTHFYTHIAYVSWASHRKKQKKNAQMFTQIHSGKGISIYKVVWVFKTHKYTDTPKSFSSSMFAPGNNKRNIKKKNRK